MSTASEFAADALAMLQEDGELLTVTGPTAKSYNYDTSAYTDTTATLTLYGYHYDFDWFVPV